MRSYIVGRCLTAAPYVFQHDYNHYHQDASNVYGSSEEELQRIRDGSTPYLRMGSGDLLPDDTGESGKTHGFINKNA